MNKYHIEPIGPGLVKVHEYETSYPMTQIEAEENLATVKASREKYDCDDDYLRRVNFYEDVLSVMEK